VSFGLSGLRSYSALYLGLRSRWSLQPRLSHDGPSGLDGAEEFEGKNEGAGSRIKFMSKGRTGWERQL
jgi:hypothetical protein